MPHPVIAAAAQGRLPEWALLSHDRHQHVIRVARLMEQWAVQFGLPDSDVVRWHAAGLLHDALRDEDPDALRPLVAPDFRDLPGKMLHGPAAAARLRADGVDDGPLLLAVAWHTLGHPDFDRLGRALYLADYMEPGRHHDSPELDARRERVPEDLDGVLRETVEERIGWCLLEGHPLQASTVGFWNALVRG